MLGEILHRITIVEVIVAVLMFIIIRSIVWCLRQAAKAGETEAQKLIHGHVHKRHGGHYRSCKDCSTDIAISTIDLAL